MNLFHIDRFAHLGSPVHRFPAPLKLVLALGTVGLVAWNGALPVFFGVGVGCLLLVGVLWSRVPPSYALTRLLYPAPVIFFLGVFLPFTVPGAPLWEWTFGPLHLTVTREGLQAVEMLWLKCLLSVSTVVILVITTPFNSLLRGLQKLRVPGLFVMLLGFIYRYLFLVAEEVHRLGLAVSSRSFALSGPQRMFLRGRLLGVLFQRSLDRSVHVTQAMLSRGFDGSFQTLDREYAAPVHFLAAGLILTVLVALRFGGW